MWRHWTYSWTFWNKHLLLLRGQNEIPFVLLTRFFFTSFRWISAYSNSELYPIVFLVSSHCSNRPDQDIYCQLGTGCLRCLVMFSGWPVLCFLFILFYFCFMIMLAFPLNYNFNWLGFVNRTLTRFPSITPSLLLITAPSSVLLLCPNLSLE